MPNVFSLGVLSINGTQHNQVEQQTLSTGLREYMQYSGGVVDPHFVSVMSGEPVLGFRTTALKRSIDALGLLGTAITSGSGGAIMYFQKQVSGGTRGGSSTALSVTLSDGIAVAVSIDADEDSAATISYDLHGLSTNGTTWPLSYSASATMPTDTGGDQKYTVGPVTIAGTTINGVIRSRCMLQPQLNKVRGDGFPWPTHISLKRRQVGFEVTTTELDKLATLGAFRRAFASTDYADVYFRKLAEGGDRVDAATAEHVRCRATDGLVMWRESSGTDDQPNPTATIYIIPAYDGTNPLLAVNTAVALP